MEDSSWSTTLWCAAQGFRCGSANILFRFCGVATAGLIRRASRHGSISSSFSLAKTEMINLAPAESLHWDYSFLVIIYKTQTKGKLNREFLGSWH